MKLFVAAGLLTLLTPIFAAPLNGTASSSTQTATSSAGQATSSPMAKKYPSISFTPADSPPLVPLFNTSEAKSPAVLEALHTIPFPRTLLSTLAHAQGLFVPLMGVLGHSFDGRERILSISDWLSIVCRVGCRLDAEYVFANNVHGLTIVGWDAAKINELNMTASQPTMVRPCT